MGIRKKRIKARYVIIIFAVVLIVAVCAVVFWQWDNIEALRYSQSMSEDEIEQQIEENKDTFDKVVKEYGISTENLTEEDILAVTEGMSTMETVIEKILSSSGQFNTQDSLDGQDDMEVKRLVASLYVLREGYASKLDGLIQEAKTEFYNLAPEERTDTARRRIVAEKISVASSLESSCDAQVSDIVQDLRARLAEIGQDSSRADQIMSVYQREKTLKKASCLSQLS